jgi:pyruvate/2-oxoglutarate/acetoin dehydrogenase E1 component/TPP-dependent pyruvate/acetoin dehydrogenase alpha subunit
VTKRAPGTGINTDLSPCAQQRTPKITFRYAALKSAPANNDAPLGKICRTGDVFAKEHARAMQAPCSRTTTPAGKDRAKTGSAVQSCSTTRVTPKLPQSYETDTAWQTLRAELGFQKDAPATEQETMLYHLWLAQVSRSLDETQTEWTKGRIPFAVWGAGQELAQTLMVAEGPRFISGYYRDLAGTLASGATDAQQIMAQVLGDTEPGHDPASGGRMMGSHFGDVALDADGNRLDMSGKIRIVSRSSALASQMPTAAGIGAELKGTGDFNLVLLGDATCAEGLFWESLNQMAIEGQPTVVMVMDNDFGISVPSSLQVAHSSISQAAAGFSPAVKIIGPVKGWEYDAIQSATREAANVARTEQRPVLLHVKCTRPFGHSSTGGTRAISAERLQYEQQSDCLEHLAKTIKDRDVAKEATVEKVRKAATEHAQTASQAAWEAYYTPIAELATEALALFHAACPKPNPSSDPSEQARFQQLHQQAQGTRARCDANTPSSLTRSEIEIFLRDTLDALYQSNTSSEAVTQLAQFIQSLQEDSMERWSSNVFAPPAHSGAHATPVAARYADDHAVDNNDATAKAAKDTQAHIISASLSCIMKSLPGLKVFGEDTGALGGVSTCTLGLQSGEAQVLPEIWKRSPALQQYIPKAGFGQRVFDTGIAEAYIIGKAIGRAQFGKPSVAEIQYLDYMPFALQQLIDEAGPMRHRTDGGQETPFLVRTHGHRLLGMWHSGSPMGMLMGIPGIRVLVPRNGTQANGLYRAALVHGKDPAVSIESLSEMYTPEPVPENLAEHTVPLGHSEVLVDTTPEATPENQCTIITYGGASCKIAQQATNQLAKKNIGVRVVDLQTLSPLDTNQVARDAIRATGKVLWLDEDYPNGAMAMIAKSLLHDGPEEDKPFYNIESQRFLTARPHKPAYGKDGGYYSKPQTYDVVDAVRRLLDDADGGKRAPNGVLSQEALLSKIQ